MLHEADVKAFLTGHLVFLLYLTAYLQKLVVLEITMHLPYFVKIVECDKNLLRKRIYIHSNKISLVSVVN